VTVVCAFDLGFRNDASAAAVVRRVGDGYTLIGHMEQRPRKGAPLVPGAVLADVAALCKRHGCARAVGDGFYAETSREVLSKHRIGFELAPMGASGKLQVWQVAKELVLSGRAITPNITSLLAQLKLVRSKPLSGGSVSIEQPRKAGSHGDLAAAFALALWAAHETPEWPAGPLYVGISRDAMKAKFWGDPVRPEWHWHADQWDDDD
jgi:hypothetical protein